MAGERGRSRRAVAMWSRSVAVVMAVLLVTACSSGTEGSRPASTAEVTFEHGDGPLSATVGAGGMSGVARPAGLASFSASFGEMVLCHRSTGRAPVFDSIRALQRTGQVESVEFWLRRGTGTGEQVPFISARGRAPKFDEKYSDIRASGRYSPVRSTAVAEPCEMTNRLNGPFNELVVVVTAGAGGASLRGFRLKYHVGEAQYATKLDYEVIVCGRLPEIAARCRRS